MSGRGSHVYPYLSFPSPPHTSPMQQRVGSSAPFLHIRPWKGNVFYMATEDNVLHVCTERRFILCKWFGEFCSCCSLTALLGPAWVLLNWICKELISSLYCFKNILTRPKPFITSMKWSMKIFFPLLKKQTGGTNVSPSPSIVIRRLSDMQRQRRRRCTLHCIAKKGRGVNLQQRWRMKWVIHLVVVQASASRRVLGCVNSLPRPDAAGTWEHESQHSHMAEDSYVLQL